MGADLYFTKKFKNNRYQYESLFQEAVKKRDQAITDEEKKQLQIEVDKYYNLMYSEGYFRDSYNSSSLLWQFDLSWWRDITPLLEKGNITPQIAKEILDLMQKRESIFDNNLTKFGKEDVKYFMQKYIIFKKFLHEAINTNTPIEASL